MTHPDAQKKAFEEIVNVVGTSRLPTLADQPNLPYLGAFMREVNRYALLLGLFFLTMLIILFSQLRFNPVTPVIPRSPVQQDEYDGARIPENTWIMTNIW